MKQALLTAEMIAAYKSQGGRVTRVGHTVRKVHPKAMKAGIRGDLDLSSPAAISAANMLVAGL